jgi:hypothetical protein
MKGGPNIWGVLLSWLRGEGVTLRARVVLALAVTAVVAVLWHKLDFHAQLGVGVALICAGVYVLLGELHVLLSKDKRFEGSISVTAQADSWMISVYKRDNLMELLDWTSPTLEGAISLAKEYLSKEQCEEVSQADEAMKAALDKIQSGQIDSIIPKYVGVEKICIHRHAMKFVDPPRCADCGKVLSVVN